MGPVLYLVSGRGTVVQELKWEARKWNARLKQQQKMAGGHSVWFFLPLFEKSIDMSSTHYYLLAL